MKLSILMSMTTPINVKAEILIEKLSKLASEKKPVDLKDELQKVILDIIALVNILIFEVNI